MGGGVARVGNWISLVILNEELDDIIRILKPQKIQEYWLIKYEILVYETKKQEYGYLGVKLDPLDPPVLGGMLSGEGVLRAGKVVLIAERGYKNMDHMDKNFFVLFHPLSNIEMNKYFYYWSRFFGNFCIYKLHRIKDGAYVMNLVYKNIKERIQFYCYWRTYCWA